MRIDDPGPSTYTPPPPPPVAKTDTAQQGDTVQSVAKRNNVSPQALAAANHISTGATLRPGLVLTIPVEDPASTTQHDNPPPATPQQQVDQAVARYEAAVNAHDDAAAAQARQDVFAAVRNEIGPQVNAANANIPPDFRTPSDQQITSYGNVILRRHDGDPAAQGVLKDAINDYQIQRKADDLIPQFSGPFTPKEKLDSLKTSLAGQPREVIDRVMQNSAVQRMLKDASDWVAEPFKGTQFQTQAAQEASQRLADLTDGLPPAYVAQIVQQSMPTIQKIAGVEAHDSGPGPFANLSRVVGALGDDPNAKALTSQIAQGFRAQYDKWDGYFNGRGGYVEFAVGDGASPKLALELASQLKASGKTENAGALVYSVESGFEKLQSRIQKDMQEYSDQTKDLSWLINNAKGKLDDAQMQKAIDTYIQQQGPDWQNKLKETEDKIVSDTHALNDDIGQLEGMSDDLKQAAPGVLDALNKNVGENETTQKAQKFALTKDPTLFAGENGSKAFEFWVEVSHKVKDMMPSLLQGYVSGIVLPQIAGVNTTDPASVAKVNQVLDKFQADAKKMGLPQQEVDWGVNKVREILQTLQTTKSPPAAAEGLEELKKLNTEMTELKEGPFTSGAMGMAFRTIGLGLSGAALLNQWNTTIENTNAKNVIGTLALSVGLASDAQKFGETVGMLNADATWSVGRFGVAASKVGMFAEGLFGALNFAYYAAGAAQDISKNNAPGLIFDTAGATGAVLATAGALGIGASWAGPVGWGLMILATVGTAIVERQEEFNHHTEIAEKFLAGADVDEMAAKALSGDALEEATTIQHEFNLSPRDLQELAKNHPEVFQGPNQAQAVIDVAHVAGVNGSDLSAFLDAAKKDNPNYIQFFTGRDSDRNSPPMTHAANLFDVIKGLPTALNYVKEHSATLVGPDADARRQADRNWESSDHSTMNLVNYLANNPSAAYQAEMIRVMQQNGRLSNWVRDVSERYSFNPPWREAARSAMQAAANAGVLSQSDAQTYLSQLH